MSVLILGCDYSSQENPEFVYVRITKNYQNTLPKTSKVSHYYNIL